MALNKQVKCRRCGETFSALRSRCPNCGTRRVTQSGRTPAATPSTVSGTQAYQRANTNSRWQMIFGLVLVVAVILAVIVLVSTGLNSSDAASVRVTPTPPISVADQGVPEIEAAPTPTPTPTPTVESVVIRYNVTQTEDITMYVGDPDINLNAVVYPQTIENAVINWSSSDSSILKVTTNADGEAVCTAIAAGTVNVTAEAYGVTATCIFRIHD